MGLEVGELAFHGPSEEPDDLEAAVGLSADDGPELLDAEVFYVVVWAVRQLWSVLLSLMYLCSQ